MIEKYSSCTSLLGPEGKRTQTYQLWQDRYMEENKQTRFPSHPFFSLFLFFIHFQGMQVQCTTKTQHQAMESSRAEEMKLLWWRRRRRRRALYIEETARFKKQPELVQSGFGTRCLSHSQMAAINHSLVITCQTSMFRPFLVRGR